MTVRLASLSLSTFDTSAQMGLLRAVAHAFALSLPQSRLTVSNFAITSLRQGSVIANISVTNTSSIEAVYCNADFVIDSELLSELLVAPYFASTDVTLVGTSACPECSCCSTGQVRSTAGTCVAYPTCASGSRFAVDTLTCVDVDECAVSPCSVSARCDNLTPGFKCSCLSGYSGDGFNCTGENNALLSLKHPLF